ncbi:MAG: NAD(P)-dependent oxidoreductase [Acidobacteria bacterium]|nr:NAD(P)-dependent oxidoreductase [Acidobacteriota bacterium]
MTSVAFIGLGVMGYPMAGHLAKTGHEITVYNRTESTATRWLHEYSGKSAQTPAAAATGADFVFVCVGNDDDVREVVLDTPGALAGMAPGSVLVDHTTASAALAEELFSAALDVGVGFIDAPVSGGEAGAKNGALTVMCGGEESVFAAAQPIMDRYARAVTLLGPAGSGQLTKMVNQVCIAGLLEGLSEGLELGRRCGLDLDRVIEVISQGAAGSWQMENRAHTMSRGEFDFGFALDWMRKDLQICLAQARSVGAPMPLTETVNGFYDELSADGMGQSDSSALIARLRDRE